MDIPRPDPQLLPANLTVLHNLISDIHTHQACAKGWDGECGAGEFDDQSTLRRLDALKDEPSVSCSWDLNGIPFSKGLTGGLLCVYIVWVQTAMRNPVDAVFLTHILLYLGP